MAAEPETTARSRGDRSGLLAMAAAASVTAVAALTVAAGYASFEFDVALACYGGASLFALFALSFRFALWAQRPPTWQFFTGGLRALLTPRLALSRSSFLLRRCLSYFACNIFIARRDRRRWAAHYPVMVGCLMAAAIAFPLVFGWVWFETPGEDFTSYQMLVFGLPTLRFRTDGVVAFLLFHGLVWAALPVLAGVLIALHRRLHDRGDAAVQTFADDFVPLLLLFAISLSGLFLTISYTWLDGVGFSFLAIGHAITVIFTLLWLPFGKLFHIVQRVVKFTEMAYRWQGEADGMQACARCQNPYASRRQIADLIRVEAQLGYRYQLPRQVAMPEHYQEVCPRCRRALLALAQAERLQRVRPVATPAGRPTATVEG